MTSNKTKEEIAEGGPLRKTTLSCACEPVPEVKTDVADSSGSVKYSWLGWFCQWWTSIYSKSKSQGQGLSTLTKWFSSTSISSCFRHSNCINTTAAMQGTFILELMPWSMDWAFFIPIVRKNSWELSRISVNLCPILACIRRALNQALN